MPGATLIRREVNSAMPAIMRAWVWPLRIACSFATVTFTLMDSANTQPGVRQVTVNKQCLDRKSSLYTLTRSKTGFITLAGQCTSAAPLPPPHPPGWYQAVLYSAIPVRGMLDLYGRMIRRDGCWCLLCGTCYSSRGIADQRGSHSRVTE